jgi:hypothetical protein
MQAVNNRSLTPGSKQVAAIAAIIQTDGREMATRERRRGLRHSALQTRVNALNAPSGLRLPAQVGE